ncbi:MAG: hypothetical protein H8K03_20420 [Nitrospira sp.]
MPMQFAKGREKTGGRQMGTPNRATVEFKEFWQEFFESEAYRESLKERVLEGKADHMERYAAELLYGRPRQEISMEDNSPRIFINRMLVGERPQNDPTLTKGQSIHGLLDDSRADNGMK